MHLSDKTIKSYKDMITVKVVIVKVFIYRGRMVLYLEWSLCVCVSVCLSFYLAKMFYEMSFKKNISTVREVSTNDQKPIFMCWSEMAELSLYINKVRIKAKAV